MRWNWWAYGHLWPPIAREELGMELETPAPTRTTVEADLAFEVIGVGRQTGYRLIAAGTLPVLPLPGRKRIAVSALDRLLDRKLTEADFHAAEVRLAPRRAALRDYGTTYRENRAALATKKAATAEGR